MVDCCFIGQFRVYCLPPSGPTFTVLTFHVDAVAVCFVNEFGILTVKNLNKSKLATRTIRRRMN